MRPKKLLSVCLLFSLIIGGSFALALPHPDINDPSEPPDIEADCVVNAGDSLLGYAWDCDAPIDVEARWNGSGLHLSGSPDPGGLGTKNYFSFATSLGDSGKTFTIIATDGKGYEHCKIVTVL